MKLLVFPKEPTWWGWVVSLVCLAFGLAGFEDGFRAAIALTLAQSAWFLAKLRSWSPYTVQIRLGFLAILLLFYPPPLRWLYWLPAIGALIRVLLGYCIMARFLSVMPWNRFERLSLGLLRRTFLTPPVSAYRTHEMAPAANHASGCEAEANIAHHASAS